MKDAVFVNAYALEEMLNCVAQQFCSLESFKRWVERVLEKPSVIESGGNVLIIVEGVELHVQPPRCWRKK